MALLWADGFDHYLTGATGRTNMLAGSWAEVFSGHTPETTKPRNSICSLACTGAGNSRRVFGSDLSAVGVGGAFWVTTLPTQASKTYYFSLQDSGNVTQVALVAGTTGTLELRLGSITGTVLATSAVCITAGAWHHVEMFWESATGASGVNADGTVIVKVDEATVISLVGNVDNVSTANLHASQVYIFGNSPVGGATGMYLDDVFAWDTTTSENNDFLGDKDILPYYTDADGATVEWTPSSGTDHYEMVNYSASEPDGDTSYLQAGVNGDVEELEVETIPASIQNIVAAVMFNVAKKTDAAACAFTPALISNAAVGSGSAHTLTEGYVYYYDPIALDPDTSTAWTAATLGAAQVRLTRTT